MPVSLFVRVTIAPGITACCASRTVPTTAAFCAKLDAAPNNTNTNTKHIELMFFIPSSNTQIGFWWCYVDVDFAVIVRLPDGQKQMQRVR